MTLRSPHRYGAAFEDTLTAVWLGWESLRRHGTRLSESPAQACVRLRDVLAQAA